MFSSPSGRWTAFSELVGVGSTNALWADFTFKLLPVLADSDGMLGTEAVLSIDLLTGVWCWTESPDSILLTGVGLIGLTRGSETFLCVEKDILFLVEVSVCLERIPDLRLELGSLQSLLGFRLLGFPTLVFKEEFSFPAHYISRLNQLNINSKNKECMRTQSQLGTFPRHQHSQL